MALLFYIEFSTSMFPETMFVSIYGFPENSRNDFEQVKRLLLCLTQYLELRYFDNEQLPLAWKVYLYIKSFADYSLYRDFLGLLVAPIANNTLVGLKIYASFLTGLVLLYGSLIRESTLLHLV